ncbi:hypothetical protein PV408_00005 [Streptomyces sp. ME18-1-4]|nr:hypothetical protein [Streptomyces sp. ME18-1-4]
MVLLPVLLVPQCPATHHHLRTRRPPHPARPRPEPRRPRCHLPRRRQAHLSCRTRAELDVSGGSGGLAVRLDEVRVIARIDPLRSVVARSDKAPGPVVLGLDITARTALDDARTGPDVVRFGTCQEDGTFTELVALDGRYLTTEVAGGFTGRVIGPYATDGRVHLRAAHPLTPLAP